MNMTDGLDRGSLQERSHTVPQGLWKPGTWPEGVVAYGKTFEPNPAGLGMHSIRYCWAKASDRDNPDVFNAFHNAVMIWESAVRRTSSLRFQQDPRTAFRGPKVGLCESIPSKPWLGHHDALVVSYSPKTKHAVASLGYYSDTPHHNKRHYLKIYLASPYIDHEKDYDLWLEEAVVTTVHELGRLIACRTAENH
jgi:hypothetical protein